MKNSFIATCSPVIFCFFFLSCLGKNDVRIGIHENGGKLNIKIEANKNGKDIDYNESFNVERLTKAQKDSIVKRITDSLKVVG